jgi:hypothetical protein
VLKFGEHRQREILEAGGKTNLLVSYAVNVVSQFMHDPRKAHMDDVERILRYLKSNPGKGILFSTHGNLKVEGYTNADWAGSKNDRRSTSGYFTFVGGIL